MLPALRSIYLRPRPLLFSWQIGQGAPIGLAFTGGAGRTYLDSNGVLQSVGANVPRLNAYARNSSSVLVPGWLLENASTNHFLQSGTPATQTTSSLATGTYTVWLVGTGQIVVSAGTATITGAGTATAAAPVTFVVTVAGTVTYTVSGSPTRAQAENLPFPSSYIPTTTVPVTRSAEVAPVPFPYAPMVLTIYLKLIDQGSISGPNAAGLAGISNSANVAARAVIFASSRSVSGAYLNVNASTRSVGSGVGLGDTAEVRLTIDGSAASVIAASKNGGTEVVSSATAGDTFAASWSAGTLWLNANGSSFTGYTLLQSIKIARGVQSLAYMLAA